MADFFGQELHEGLDLEDTENQEDEAGIVEAVVWKEEKDLEEEREEESMEDSVGEDQPKTKLVLRSCLKALYPEGRPLTIVKAGLRVEVEEEKDGWTKLKKGGYVRSSNLGD